MKVTVLLAALCGLAVASCAHPLEQIVDERHQQRIDAANANLSLSHGAADGLGSYIAQNHAEAEASSQRHP